jgi:ABC-type antimicrobial peptide transport system permease subunit
VLGRVIVLLAVGSGAGLFVGLFAARFLSGVIYEAASGDPMLSTLVLLTMGAVGLGSAWIPARRALGLDPMRALRES